MRTHATFQLELPEPDVQGPPGEELVDRLSRAFAEHGAKITGHERHARLHLLALEHEGHRYRLVVGRVDAERHEWLVAVDSRLSRFRRLLGTRDTETHGGLLSTLESALEGDERIRELRWMTLAEWKNQQTALTGDER